MRGTNLDQAIMRTVAWFSVFSYPVTVFEIWKWLYEPDRSYSLREVFQAIDGPIGNQMQTKNGFYTLRSFESIDALIHMRHDRFLDAVRKYAKLRRAAKLFSFVPYVEGVAAGNTLSWWHTKPESDIDLFIIVRKGTIWSSRALLVLPFALLGKRPQMEAGEVSGVDPFCFSFFVTNSALGMSKLSIGENDPYMAYWTRSVVPVFDRGGIFDVFERENEWTSNYLPNAEPRDVHKQLGVHRRISLPLFRLEALARKLQQKRFPAHIKEQANQDSRIIISDDVLKFHANDRREKYKNIWMKVLERTNG